ncbi:MAG: response regulator transcription factor [Bacteroidales bacterium]|nr:response regulator transcription factor [Bacteroidales bacterium]
MKILIVEDEVLAAKRMMQLLTEIEPDCKLFGPFDTVSSAVSHLKVTQDYDLIFLDIQLADGKSFSIFEAVKVNIPVIFTTAYDEYALQAFTIHSIDYLLKPVNKEKLHESLEKFKKIRNHFGGADPNGHLYELITKLQAPTQSPFRDRFLINKGDSMVPVKVNEVACFFAGEKVVTLFTIENKQYIIPQTLDELEAKLDPRLFFRVNRQFIVAAEAIQKVHNYFNFKLKVEIKPDPGTEIIVSRARASEFKSWLSE